MVAFKKREKVIAGIGISLILVLGFERVMLSGLRSRVGDLNRQIKLEEGLLKERLVIHKNKDRITQESLQYSGYFLSENNDRDIIARFLKEFEKITRESGVSVVSLNPENQCTLSGEYKKCKADARLEGGVEQVFKFLQGITKSTLLIRIDHISIVPKDEQANTLKVDAVVNMVIP